MTPVEIVAEALTEARRVQAPFFQPRTVTLAHIAVQALQESGHLPEDEQDKSDA